MAHNNKLTKRSPIFQMKAMALFNDVTDSCA